MINKKKQKRILILTIGLLVLSIGFAALAAQLKIDGTINVSKNSWNVHFENVDITPGSVTANPVPVTDDDNKNTTEITYTVNFTKPGDFYEFTVDMVNSGTIDAMIDILVNGLFETDGETAKTLPSYLESSIKYNDGIDIARYHYLKANTTEKIKVRVAFRTDINPSDLPSTAGESMKFILKADFKQADSNAREIDRIAVGEYISLIPDVQTYSVPLALTGYNSDQTIKIAGTNASNGLRLWRVIDIHSDGSFDVVSEYVSSDNVYFKGTTGYANFVGALNTIASQYQKSGYTIGSRIMGYDGQTEIIGDTSAFDESTTDAPSTTTTPSPTTGIGEEYLGGVAGDTLYLKDIQLVGNVYKSDTSTYGSNGLKAYKVGTTTATKYWIASRKFKYNSPTDFSFQLRSVDTDGGLSGGIIRKYDDGWGGFGTGLAIRPILTLRSGISISGGTGTKDNPYTFN